MFGALADAYLLYGPVAETGDEWLDYLVRRGRLLAAIKRINRGLVARFTPREG